MKREFTYDMLAKYFGDTCSVEEKEAIEIWAEQNPEEYSEYLMCWTMSEDFDYPNVQNEFSEIKNRIAPEEKVIPLFNYNKLLRIAAVFVVLAVIGAVAYNYKGYTNSSDSLAKTYESNKGERVQVELSDGSTAWLNAGSKLIQADGFGKDNRNITLTGEAFFDVERNESLPFIIASGNVEVKVLGTSFLVENYAGNDEAVVSVKSGIVSVSGGGNSLELKALESALFVKSNGELVKGQNSANDEWAWLENVIVFNKTPLNEVVKELERQFDVTIKYNKAYADVEFTGKFKSQSIKEILKVIETSLSVDLKITK